VNRPMSGRTISIYMLSLAGLLVSVNTIAAKPPCQQHNGHVARAMFTTRIENREPVDKVLILENNHRVVYFFTDLRNLQGHAITHRWEYNGKVVMQKIFKPAKGPRWRLFSKKELDPAMTGDWTVVVTDEKDCPLKAVVFKYKKHQPNGEGSAILPP
jgi:hypothetical protein